LTWRVEDTIQDDGGDERRLPSTLGRIARALKPKLKADMVMK
jgi:hypothetical protein